MALENKKSQLQPTTIQAQQYRLQYSNLQDRASQATTYNRAAGLVPNTSQFAGRPAPVALAAPVAQPVQAPTTEKVYRTSAGVFGGNTYFTSSIGDIDLNGVTSGSLSFVFMIKPDAVPTREKQYLLHAYTGSFASHSLEVTLNGYNLEIRGTNAGKYSRFYATIPANVWGNQDNGYTLIEIGRNPQSVNAPNMPLAWTSFYARVGNRAYNLIPKGNGIVTSHDLPLADQLYIGGTPYTAGSNFSGSIAFAMIKGNTRLTSVQYNDLGDSKITAGSIIPQVRAYTFDGTGAIEDPGTLANVNVTLGVTGSYSTTTGYY